METRANYLLIGSFVLLLVGAAFGFVIWLAKVEIDREFKPYRIFFEQSISGLTIGGDVRYNGIPVGNVTNIVIAPQDPSKVMVDVEIGSETKVYADTVARLEMQGLTGVAYIQLSGGNRSSKVLEPGPNGKLPVIRSERSTIQELLARGPELMGRVMTLIDSLNELAGPENRKAFTGILANADKLSGTLAGRGPQIAQALDDVSTAARKLSQASQKLNDVMDGADATLAVARGTLTTMDSLADKDARQAIDRFGEASRHFAALTGRLDSIMQENRQAISAFSGDGLVRFMRFIDEARDLVASTSRLVEDLRSDPSRFLLGNQAKEFKPQ
ncbi:MAG TPA: MlaD family protein [Alphaproteobacteria bacterium]|nr:MlaD family protein [Alphaproteobacteria bacterium]